MNSSAADKDPDLIEVAVPLPVYTPYTYRVPPRFSDAVAVGKRVLVPFGSHQQTGYVLSRGCRSIPDQTIKAIIDVLDESPLFPASMIPFFRWVADYYIHPLGEVIQTALPAGLTLAEQTLYQLTVLGQQALAAGVRESQERVLLSCLDQEACTFSQLNAKFGGGLARSRLNQWVTKGWVTRHRGFSSGRLTPKVERLVVPLVRPETIERLSRQRALILELLQCNGPMLMPALKARVATAAGLVRAMAADGQVAIEEQEVFRDPLGEPIAPDQAPVLTEEQDKVVETMTRDLGRGFQTYLLSGVTGSGKTEVYLRMAALAKEGGLPVLVLIPEIALISQMERAFRARFGDCVGLLHSGLTRGERYDQWRRIAQGRYPIVMGARSAIFAPFEKIGLIIVDEEHDDSYKQEGALRYNARDMAVVRGRQNQALVVLGSATPSLQSAHNVETGKFKPVYLWQRVDRSELPRIHIEDLGALREERGLRRHLSPALLSAMRQTLERREQVLLFLNRRGFANTLVCDTCGQPLRCDHCDISLTYHQASNAYKCHYCGSSKAALTRCSHCGSGRIKRLGIGTERLEKELQSLFPGARLARMDRDTTRRKGAVVKILKALRQGRIDILIGTQMVAKGHDYPNITLVGIVCADLSLNFPDFRAGERTFQLLAQVAGRAGRGSRPGQVVLQTYNPEHFSINAARNQDFEMFYRQETALRKALQYPPHTRMIQIRINGSDKRRTADHASWLGELCQKLRREQLDFSHVQVLGPIEAPLARIANQYRWQLLLKSPRADALHRMVHALLFGPGKGPAGSVARVSLDVDPVFFM